MCIEKFHGTFYTLSAHIRELVGNRKEISNVDRIEIDLAWPPDNESRNAERPRDIAAGCCCFSSERFGSHSLILTPAKGQGPSW